MTMKEIKSLLNISTSTMSDWNKSEKRSKLAKLLKNIDINTVQTLLDSEDTQPKYSTRTQKIKLNKKLFTKDILWAQEDGSEVYIKNLISAFFNIPNQEDTLKTIQLFGVKRVLRVLHKHKLIMTPEDYQENYEQIQYATSPKEYYDNFTLPDVDIVLQHPKQRHVDKLKELYTEDALLQMAKDKDISLSTLMQIKKFLNKPQ